MFLDEEFDVNTLPVGDNNFDPLPAGWYSTTIQGAELKNTKSGSGQYIAIKYAITGPTHQGRVVFGNFNIKNANPTAESIGRQQIGELMRAIGVARVSLELLNNYIHYDYTKHTYRNRRSRSRCVFRILDCRRCWNSCTI